MPPLPVRRSGDPLEILSGTLGFSFWPMRRTTRRYGLNTKVFAKDPWPVIRRSIEEDCPLSARPEALAYMDQAKDFYRAAENAGTAAAKPLLLYYGLLNLAKAFALAKGTSGCFDKARHGLSDGLRPAGREPTGSFVTAFPTTARDLNFFDEFLKALRGCGLSTVQEFDLPLLMPQIVPGHRLWVDAAGQEERFLRVSVLDLMHSVTHNEIWMLLSVAVRDLARLGVTHQDLLVRSQLGGHWHEVRETSPDLLCFEQNTPIKYTSRAADEVAALVDTIKPCLWQTVIPVPPYRNYYLYLAPPAECGYVLPQMASIFTLMFYLGSITRYRPHHFDTILAGEYGPFIEGFLNDQPMQFLFLMASEFAKRDVTKAALI